MTSLIDRLAAALAALTLAAPGMASAGAADAPYWPPITESPTGEHHPGRFVWVDLLTRDVGRAAEFYGKVFGWTFETFGPADDSRTYTLASANGRPVAGLVFSNPRDRSLRPDARWVGLISVADVKATVDRAVAAGGKQIMEPRQLGERGVAALCADPENALFGVLRSDSGDPSDYRADPGEWIWGELWADDAAAMARFYEQVAGFTLKETAPGSRAAFRLMAGAYARGGVLAKPVPGVPTTWVPFLRVADLDDTMARASAAGATVVVAPSTSPAADFAVLLDPTGAPLGVAEIRP